MSNYDAILAEAESNRAAAGDLERRYARCPRSAPDDPRAPACAREMQTFSPIPEFGEFGDPERITHARLR